MMEGLTVRRAQAMELLKLFRRPALSSHEESRLCHLINATLESSGSTDRARGIETEFCFYIQGASVPAAELTKGI